MSIHQLSALSFIASAVWVNTALADITYHYQSSDLTPRSTSLSQSTSPFTISITFNDSGTELLNWVFSHEIVGTVTKADYEVQPIHAVGNIVDYFRTDANGTPTDWALTLHTQYDLPAPKINQSFSTASYPWSGSVNDYAVSYGYPISGPQDINYFGTSRVAGIWTSEGRVLTNYIYQPVPEPSTYAMLLAGVAGIALLRRKVRQG